MKRFFIGLLTGLILATTTLAFAANPIKLIVNGKEVRSDVPAQVIRGRTMVPARFLAEALGAKVEWDEKNNAVVVTTLALNDENPTDLPAVTSPAPDITPPQNFQSTPATPPATQQPQNPSTNNSQAEIDKNTALKALEEQEIQNRRREAERKHQQKLSDLQSQRRYHELRTGSEHTRAIAEIDKQIVEENHNWEAMQEQWKIDDEKRKLQD